MMSVTRSFFSWLETHRSRYTVVRWLFPRLLAAISLIAFISWGVPYDGLVGDSDILRPCHP